MDRDHAGAYEGFRASLQAPLDPLPEPPAWLVPRLVDVYRKSHRVLTDGPYRYGAIWGLDIATRRREYLDALAEGDVGRLAGLLRTFHRNGGGAGISQARAAIERADDEEFCGRWVARTIAKYRALGRRHPEALALCYDSPVGAPVVVPYRGRRLTWNVLRHSAYCAALPRTPCVVVELGGGYGSLARLWMQSRPGSTYVLLDLPEVLLVAAYFIVLTLPTARVAMMDDFTDIAAADVVLLPHSTIEALPDGVADLVINTGSLAEMDPDIVDNYLRQLARVTKRGGLFYTVNRRVGLPNFGGALETGMFSWRWPAQWEPGIGQPSWADRWIEHNDYYERIARRI
jgi:SAM-dependent methyltransferase